MDGVLRIHKQKGMTSHDIVARARRILGQKSIGHAGTLDPMAEGLIVLLLGQATKISDYLLNGNKGYRARVLLGKSTDTWDLDGETLESQDSVQFSQDQIRAAVDELRGEFEWEVPKFSAIKQDGRKLYEKARSGEEFELPRRRMCFYEVQLIEAAADQVEVQIRCSKGSYIRSWGREFGKKLGTPSCLSRLVRDYSAPFDLKGALSLEELEGLTLADVEKHEAFLEFSQCLGDIPGMSLRGRDLKLMMNGQVPNTLVRRLLPEQKECNRSGQGQMTRIFDADQRKLVALLELRPCAPVRVRRIFKSP